MEQQQQQHLLHPAIVDGIARLSDPRYLKERHKLIIDGVRTPEVDRQSLQHLVTFIDVGDNDQVVTITKLGLINITLLDDPPDGGLDVLCTFFNRTDTTLTTVTLECCDFGSQQDAERLLAAFHTNRTVTDLSIRGYLGPLQEVENGLFGWQGDAIANLDGATVGNSLVGIMQNMLQLQRLECHVADLHVEEVRAFQPVLQAKHRTLMELSLPSCCIGDEAIHLIADAFAGISTTAAIEFLDISHNSFTTMGLDDVTRILESTRIKKIDLSINRFIFGDEASNLRFANAVSRHGFLKDLCLYCCRLRDSGIHIIVNALAGNTILEVLNISHNCMTPAGLADITRLLQSPTRIKTFTFIGGQVVLHVNGGEADLDIFSDAETTQHFVTALQQMNYSVQEMPGMDISIFRDMNRSRTRISESMFAIIDTSLARNKQLNRVALLLAPPPAALVVAVAAPQQQQQGHGNAAATTMMLKIWHKAIVKIAKVVPSHSGASAIFKLLRERPQLLEKRIKPPPVAAATVTAGTAAADNSQEPKRRRRL